MKTALQLSGQFAIQTVGGILPRFAKLAIAGLTASQANYVPHNLPTGAAPLAVFYAPGITAGGLWGEIRPADASQQFVIASVATTVGSTAVYTGTIPDGDATNSITLTAAAAAADGVTVYTGTVTGGTNNAFAGQWFTITVFDNGANNGTFLCIASTATTLTLVNASGATDTHAGTAVTGGLIGSYFTIAGFATGANNGTFQCIGQTGTTLTLANGSAVAQTTATGTATGGFLYLQPATGGALYGSAYIIY